MSPQPDFSDGVMVALKVPDPERYAVPGGLEPSKLHVTLAYLGSATDLPPGADEAILAAARAAAAGATRVQATFPAEYGTFDDAGDGVPFWAKPAGSEIFSFRDSLVQQLNTRGLGKHVSTKYPFNPHVTLKYLDGESERIPEGFTPREPSPIHFTEVLVSIGEDETTFTLGRPIAAAAGQRPHVLQDRGSRMNLDVSMPEGQDAIVALRVPTADGQFVQVPLMSLGLPDNLPSAQREAIEKAVLEVDPSTLSRLVSVGPCSPGASTVCATLNPAAVQEFRAGLTRRLQRHGVSVDPGAQPSFEEGDSLLDSVPVELPAADLPVSNPDTDVLPTLPPTAPTEPAPTEPLPPAPQPSEPIVPGGLLNVTAAARKVRINAQTEQSLRRMVELHNRTFRGSLASVEMAKAVYARGASSTSNSGSSRHSLGVSRVTGFLDALSRNDESCPDRDLFPSRAPRTPLWDTALQASALGADEIYARLAAAAVTPRTDPERVFHLSRALALTASAAPRVRAHLEDRIRNLVADGNSSLARSMRARRQLRDRYGRWIEMGGGVRFKVREPGAPGGGQWYHGRVEGIDVPNGRVDVRLEDGRLVKVPNDKLEQPKAILNLPGQPIVPATDPGHQAPALDPEDPDTPAVQAMQRIAQALRDGGATNPTPMDVFNRMEGTRHENVPIDQADVDAINARIEEIANRGVRMGGRNPRGQALQERLRVARNTARSRLGGKFHDAGAGSPDDDDAPAIARLEEIDAPTNRVEAGPAEAQEMAEALDDAAREFAARVSEDSSEARARGQATDAAARIANEYVEGRMERDDVLAQLADVANFLEARGANAEGLSDDEREAFRAYSEDIQDVIAAAQDTDAQIAELPPTPTSTPTVNAEVDELKAGLDDFSRSYGDLVAFGDTPISEHLGAVKADLDAGQFEAALQKLGDLENDLSGPNAESEMHRQAGVDISEIGYRVGLLAEDAEGAATPSQSSTPTAEEPAAEAAADNLLPSEEDFTNLAKIAQDAAEEWENKPEVADRMNAFANVITNVGRQLLNGELAGDEAVEALNQVDRAIDQMFGDTVIGQEIDSEVEDTVGDFQSDLLTLRDRIQVWVDAPDPAEGTAEKTSTDPEPTPEDYEDPAINAEIAEVEAPAAETPGPSGETLEAFLNDPDMNEIDVTYGDDGMPLGDAIAAELNQADNDENYSFPQAYETILGWADEIQDEHPDAARRLRAAVEADRNRPAPGPAPVGPDGLDQWGNPVETPESIESDPDAPAYEPGVPFTPERAQTFARHAVNELRIMDAHPVMRQAAAELEDYLSDMEDDPDGFDYHDVGAQLAGFSQTAGLLAEANDDPNEVAQLRVVEQALMDAANVFADAPPRATEPPAGQDRNGDDLQIGDWVADDNGNLLRVSGPGDEDGIELIGPDGVDQWVPGDRLSKLSADEVEAMGEDPGGRDIPVQPELANEVAIQALMDEAAEIGQWLQGNGVENADQDNMHDAIRNIMLPLQEGGDPERVADGIAELADDIERWGAMAGEEQRALEAFDRLVEFEQNLRNMAAPAPSRATPAPDLDPLSPNFDRAAAERADREDREALNEGRDRFGNHVPDGFVLDSEREVQGRPVQVYRAGGDGDDVEIFVEVGEVRGRPTYVVYPRGRRRFDMQNAAGWEGVERIANEMITRERNRGEGAEQQRAAEAERQANQDAAEAQRLAEARRVHEDRVVRNVDDFDRPLPEGWERDMTENGDTVYRAPGRYLAMNHPDGDGGFVLMRREGGRLVQIGEHADWDSLTAAMERDRGDRAQAHRDELARFLDGQVDAETLMMILNHPNPDEVRAAIEADPAYQRMAAQYEQNRGAEIRQQHQLEHDRRFEELRGLMQNLDTLPAPLPERPSPAAPGEGPGAWDLSEQEDLFLNELPIDIDELAAIRDLVIGMPDEIEALSAEDRSRLADEIRDMMTMPIGVALDPEQRRRLMEIADAIEGRQGSPSGDAPTPRSPEPGTPPPNAPLDDLLELQQQLEADRAQARRAGNMDRVREIGQQLRAVDDQIERHPDNDGDLESWERELRDVVTPQRPASQTPGQTPEDGPLPGPSAEPRHQFHAPPIPIGEERGGGRVIDNRLDARIAFEDYVARGALGRMNPHHVTPQIYAKREAIENGENIMVSPDRDVAPHEMTNAEARQILQLIGPRGNVNPAAQTLQHGSRPDEVAARRAEHEAARAGQADPAPDAAPDAADRVATPEAAPEADPLAGQPRPARPNNAANPNPQGYNKYGVVRDRNGEEIYKGLRVRGLRGGVEGVIVAVQEQPAYVRIQLDDGRQLVRSARQVVDIDPRPRDNAPAAPAVNLNHPQRPTPAPPAAPDAQAIQRGLEELRNQIPRAQARAGGVNVWRAGFKIERDVIPALQRGDLAEAARQLDLAAAQLRQGRRPEMAQQAADYAAQLRGGVAQPAAAAAGGVDGQELGRRLDEIVEMHRQGAQRGFPLIPEVRDARSRLEEAVGLARAGNVEEARIRLEQAIGLYDQALAGSMGDHAGLRADVQQRRANAQTLVDAVIANNVPAPAAPGALSPGSVNDPVMPGDFLEDPNAPAPAMHRAGNPHTVGVRDPRLDDGAVLDVAALNPQAQQRDFASWGERAAEIAGAARSRPSATSLLQLQGDELKKAVSAAFGADGTGVVFGDGFTLRIRSASASGNSVSAEFAIYDSEGNLTGRTTRVLYFDRNGKPRHVYNSFMRNESKGGGFATGFNRYMENWYIANGFKSVQVSAAGGGGYTGGFVWALNGFHWNPDEADPSGTAGRFLRGMKRQARAGSPEMAQIEALIRKNDAGQTPTPMELALVGWRPGMGGHDRWLGKNYMESQNWGGLKRLVPEQGAQYRGYNAAKRTGGRARQRQAVVQLQGPLADQIASAQDLQLRAGERDELQRLLTAGKSIATMSPRVKRELVRWASSRLHTAGQTRDYPEMANDLLALRRVALDELRAEHPEAADIGVGDELRDLTIADMQGNQVPGWSFRNLQDVGEAGINGQLGGMYRATHLPTGQVFYVKKDVYGERVTGREGVSRDAEEDVNTLFQRMGLAGVSKGAPSRVDRSIVVHQAVGDNLPLVAEPRNAGKYRSETRREAFDNLANIEDAFAMLLADAAGGNTDRHHGNYQLGQDQNSQWWVFPIDHGLFGGGQGWQWADANTPAQFIQSQLMTSRSEIYKLAVRAAAKGMGPEALKSLLMSQISRYRSAIAQGGFADSTFQRKMDARFDWMQNNLDEMVRVIMGRR